MAEISREANSLENNNDTREEPSEGLTSHEARRRYRAYGANEIVHAKKKGIFIAFLSKFGNPLVIILLFASFVSALTGEWVNFVVIFAMILFSVVIESYQEYQSEEAAEKLKHKVAVRVVVMRDGEKKEVLVSHVTIGDLVLLEIGDVVPADAKVLSSKDFHLDESSLTGESFPVEKGEKDEVWMGSSVVNGEAQVRVVRIGKNTQIGQIADKLTHKKPETDFEKGIRKFGLLIMRITIILVFFIFITNIFFKHDIFSSLLFALALAVGLTPELLPMIVTVNLSKGAMRMAKKGVIVKHLPAIQNFGSMEILCTDKTGTITENKIRLERYENAKGGEDRKVLSLAYLNSSYQTNMKSPLDDAILAHREVEDASFQKTDEIPFDFLRKRLSVVLRKDGRDLLITKGAPEGMWDITRHFKEDGKVVHLDEYKLAKLKERFVKLSSEGFRVLTIAYKINNVTKDTYEQSDEKDLIFLGFTAFLDPPKKEVKEVLASLNRHGVDLKILTGDNEQVTAKVCKDLGIPVSGLVLGKDILHVSDEALIPLVLKANIFARLTPDEKERIIKALKKTGKVVGFMGDGVNDAISLRAADVGISVNNAVDVAKESADIILVTKSLLVLKEGIKEGRQTFANTMKYIYMGSGSNFGNMFSVSVASLFLPFLPMLPIQILLNNLIYDLSQLTLPADRVDSADIEKPQKWDMGFIKKFIYTFGPISSFFDMVTFLSLLYIFKASVPFFRTGWFMESLITQIVIILMVRTRKVPFWKSKPSRIVVLGVLIAILSGIIITQSRLGQIFEFVSLSPIYWIFLLFIIIFYITLVELAKAWFYRKADLHIYKTHH